MTRGFPVGELEEAFHGALALPPTERASFLERTCGQPALRAQVERMIEADSQARGIFTDSPLEDVPPTARRSIGRWILIDYIGSGGLGDVYRAWSESDGVTLHAAVKILRPGLNVLLHDCFVQERRILAGLDHPFIARLIDAGADAGGTSFLAMEFVDGSPLDEFLRQRSLPFTEQVELFARICAATAYLHEHGIVHGDLKPSNVIVRPDGTPKLLDFGTARLLDGEDDASHALMRLMITPAYASPERMAGLAPSATDDVYSLGRMLSEILESRTRSRDLAAIRDKCLAASPHERYESSRQLAADMDRLLGHFPVRARPASLRYTVTAFVRRNPVPCALASLVVVALVVGALVSRHQALRARRYAEQHRSVVAGLVRDEPPTPDGQQRTAYAAGLGSAVVSMERQEPPPLADLTRAWRRIAYAQAVSGRTGESIASIDRAIQWGRRHIKSGGTADARRQLGESLLYAAVLRQRRGDETAAGDLALEGIHLIGTLPDSVREMLERTPQFMKAVAPAARRQAAAGDVAGGRELLLRAVESGRAMGKAAQLRAALDLAQFERAVGTRERVTAACDAARALRPATPRLAEVCGADPMFAAMDRRRASARQARLESRLSRDPDRYRYRLLLAKRKLRLASRAVEEGDTAGARAWIEEARALAVDLAKDDSENARVLQLISRIDEVSGRVRVD